MRHSAFIPNNKLTIVKHWHITHWRFYVNETGRKFECYVGCPPPLKSVAAMAVDATAKAIPQLFLTFVKN
jgi:hypothetical protein